jgi:hypothetical protein
LGSSGETTSSLPVVVGAAVGATFFALLVLMLVLLVQRRRRRIPASYTGKGEGAASPPANGAANVRNFFARGPLDYEIPVPMNNSDDASAAHLYAEPGCGSAPRSYLEPRVRESSFHDYLEPVADGSKHHYAWVTLGQGDVSYDNVGAELPGTYDTTRSVSAEQVYDLAGSAQSGTSHYDVATQRQEMENGHGGDVLFENPAFYDSRGAHVPYDTAAACSV